MGADLFHKMSEPVQGLAEVVDGVGVGDSQEPLAAVAKGGTGDDGDLLLGQQKVCEVLAGQAEFLDAGEDVEAPWGSKQGMPISSSI